MVWQKQDPSDGQLRYLRKEGDNIVLTREKRGNLLNSIPSNARVIVFNNRLKLQMIR